MAEEKQDERAVALYAGPTDRGAVLARYGSAKLVRIQAERLQLVEKGKNGLEWHEALLVAQASLATGLSPFEPQPELWHWIQYKNNQRQLTIMRGRDGTIRLAEEAARRDGTYLMPPKFTQITEVREKLELGFGQDDLVMKAQVFDHRAADEYYSRRTALLAEGLDSAGIDERLGKEPPSDVGYASMSVSEQSQQQRAAAKFPHINRVQKRAQVEALKKRWAAHINMAALVEAAPESADAYMIEGEWREVDVEGLKDVSPTGDPRDPPKKPAKAERPYAPASVVVGVQERIEKHKGARKTEKWPGLPMTLLEVYSWQLQVCFEDPNFERPADDYADAVSQYLFAGSGVDQVTGAECRAALEWLDPIENKTGDLVPNAIAAQEARLIWKEWSGGIHENSD